jgi:hypothetical protein
MTDSLDPSMGPGPVQQSALDGSARSATRIRWVLETHGWLLSGGGSVHRHNAEGCPL